ncbi:hypothetical protein BDV06DRAFT_94308 [Aspergillus oleicola]
MDIVRIQAREECNPRVSLTKQVVRQGSGRPGWCRTKANGGNGRTRPALSMVRELTTAPADLPTPLRARPPAAIGATWIWRTSYIAGCYAEYSPVTRLLGAATSLLCLYRQRTVHCARSRVQGSSRRPCGRASISNRGPRSRTHKLPQLMTARCLSRLSRLRVSQPKLQQCFVYGTGALKG